MNQGRQARAYRSGGRQAAARWGCVGILLLGVMPGVLLAVGSQPAGAEAPATLEHPPVGHPLTDHPVGESAAQDQVAPAGVALPSAVAPAPVAASAAVRPARSEDVDAVLVIDSSGSMKETDPRRLRIPAAKMFISLLDAKDRVGLISFSDNGYPIMHLTAADTPHQAQLFAGVEKVSSKGAYTNLHAALVTGLDMLRREGDSQRRRMIVLMSDGKMDTGDFDQDKQLLAKIRGETLAALIKDGIEVYTIAFTEASDMPLMQEIAGRTAALSRLASNDRELHEVFSQIFESAKQPDMLPMEGGAFQVDAAVEEVTVVASKAAPEVEIQLEMPDGRLIAAVNAGKAVRWFKSEQFDMITIEKPPTGQWYLRSSDKRGDKAYVVTDLGMEANFGAAPIHADSEQIGEAWLHDKGEVVTKPEILGQTQFSVEVAQPDGTKLEMPLADAGMSGDRAAGDGVFANLFNLAQPGQQQVRVIAKNVNFQREKSLTVEVVAAPATAAPPHPTETPPPAVEESVQATPAVQETPQEAHPKEAAAEDAPPQTKTGMNIGLVVSVFVLVNLVLGGAVGGFIFWRRRKAAKSAAPADDDNGGGSNAMKKK